MALVLWQGRQADARGVFGLRRELARYEVAGRFAAARLPAGLAGATIRTRMNW